MKANNKENDLEKGKEQNAVKKQTYVLLKDSAFLLRVRNTKIHCLISSLSNPSPDRLILGSC